MAWLSSDDFFYPDKIRYQLEFMQRENVLVSHTNFHYINEHSAVTKMHGGPEPMSELDCLRRFNGGNPVNGCTVMIRKDLLSGVGLFNELLPYTHDLDLWLRMLLNGHRFPYLNEPLTAYRWHGGWDRSVMRTRSAEKRPWSGPDTANRCCSALLRLAGSEGGRWRRRAAC